MKQAGMVFLGLWSLGVLCRAAGFVDVWREKRKRDKTKRGYMSLKMPCKIAKVKNITPNAIGKAAHHSQCQTPTVRNIVDGPMIHGIMYIHASLLLITQQLYYTR